MADRAAALVVVALVALVVGSCGSAPAPEALATPRRSPLEFMTGDECLFCHREAIGDDWDRNLHNRTVRSIKVGVDGVPPDGALFALGARETKRWLRPGAAYGTLAMRTSNDHWDESAFGRGCAGCHASGIDPGTGAFAAVSLDCFVCHGDVTLEHSNDPARVHLSPRGDDDARAVVSTCGQCHLRGGRSRSTGRAWPRGFIAGDALFDDFEYDFSDAALAALSIADRHVALNARDVVVRGRAEVTCLTCHSVHGRSSRAHRDLDETELCFTCHVRGERRSERHTMTRAHSLCDIDDGT